MARFAARIAHGAAAARLAHLSAEHGAGVVDTDVRSLTADARKLLDAATELLGLAVLADRERGRSWAAIGDDLDVTRQAAQKRFGSAQLPTPADSPAARTPVQRTTLQRRPRPLTQAGSISARDEQLVLAEIAAGRVTSYGIAIGLDDASALDRVEEVLQHLSSAHRISRRPVPVRDSGLPALWMQNPASAD